MYVEEMAHAVPYAVVEPASINPKGAASKRVAAHARGRSAMPRQAKVICDLRRLTECSPLFLEGR